MKIYTKPQLIAELKKIAAKGWIENRRHGNQGGIGNTLEDLLGIAENNLPIPNAAEWELKSQRINTTSLTTLFHIEPSPRAIGFVPQMLLPMYGWKHSEAGKKYPTTEMSFRQTIHGNSPSDRGFMVKIDRQEKKVLISFNSKKVTDKHTNWLKKVAKNIGLKELNPQPYWGFDDLSNKAGTKLLNCFYVQAESKKENGKEFYHYTKVLMLQKFNFEGFLKALETGNILVDFDARTGHNHGTKFRMRQNCLPDLYEKVTVIV
jgi:hypothetical protein